MALWAPMPEETPATVEECLLAMAEHRQAITVAQERVLKRELTMPAYNAIYQRELEEIHKLEKLMAELQAKEGPMY